MQTCSKGQVADLARFPFATGAATPRSSENCLFSLQDFNYFVTGFSLAKIAALVSVWPLNVMVLHQHFCIRVVHVIFVSLGMEM